MTPTQQAFVTALYLAAIVCLFFAAAACIAYRYERHADRSKLPGALAREAGMPFEDIQRVVSLARDDIEIARMESQFGGDVA